VGVMPTPYQPLAIANEFIGRSGGGGSEHMKLQKLVYISYGWWIAYQETPLCIEQPEVWRHGPVFPSLYHALKNYGRDCITILQGDPFGSPPRVDDDDGLVIGLIDWVWSRYGEKSAFYLSDLTHQPDTPWQTIAKKNNFRVPFHTTIPDEVIRDHYLQLAKQSGFAVD
jgi:uncharacterized phage-associated protein